MKVQRLSSVQVSMIFDSEFSYGCGIVKWSSYVQGFEFENSGPRPCHVLRRFLFPPLLCRELGGQESEDRSTCWCCARASLGRSLPLCLPPLGLCAFPLSGCVWPLPAYFLPRALVVPRAGRVTECMAMLACRFGNSRENDHSKVNADDLYY